MFVRASLTVLLGSLLLSACGFRLAGTAELPPRFATIYLQTNNFSEIQRKALRATLTAAGAKLVAEPGADAAWLTLTLGVEPDQQLVTSASNGQIVKRVSRSLEYTVKAADGKTIASALSLHRQKDISLDDNNLLASNRERQTVVREIEQVLYDQLVQQLSRI